MPTVIKRFLAIEAASGIILLAVTIIALLIENSPLQQYYHHFLHYPFALGVSDFRLEKSLSHWINDGLMVIFFLFVGLEIKREIVQGHLSKRDQLLLPLIGAMGGMLCPALIFWAWNHDDLYAMRGWAIPSATDIAFALGVLSLLGKRVPTSLKVFLTALAILDDMGAVLIIALFYTEHLSPLMLSAAGCVFAILLVLQRLKVASLWPYLLWGVVLWAFTLGSGVHATISGVLLALTIPMVPAREGETSPLARLEHALHPYVAFCIMPIFAFANAGLPLAGLSFSAFLEPVPRGVASGLFFGKQIGVFLFSALAIRFGVARMPTSASWGQFYGVSILTGIGFTMSLFIGALAFREEEYVMATRLGVLGGSLAASVVGLAVLWWASRGNVTAKP